MLIEVDHARGPAVGDRQVIERIEDSGEASGGKPSIATQQMNCSSPEPRRVARPQLPAAEDRIQIRAGRRDVQRDVFAGQAKCR